MKRRIGSAVVAIALVSGQASLAAEACMRSAEVEADKVRFIETQLKVASLQCKNRGNTDFSKLYSSFVKEKRPFLVESTKQLARYLKRAGDASIQQYVALKAKRISMESARVSQFCDKAKLAAYYSAKSSDPVTLIPILPVRYERPVRQCM